MIEITNAVDVYVDYSKSVQLAPANPRRRFVNIWAGTSDLWFGNREVKGGTIGNKIEAGTKVELEYRGTIWVIRNGADAGMCSFSEEIDTAAR